MSKLKQDFFEENKKEELEAEFKLQLNSLLYNPSYRDYDEAEYLIKGETA